MIVVEQIHIYALYRWWQCLLYSPNTMLT